MKLLAVNLLAIVVLAAELPTRLIISDSSEAFQQAPTAIRARQAPSCTPKAAIAHTVYRGKPTTVGSDPLDTISPSPNTTTGRVDSSEGLPFSFITWECDSWAIDHDVNGSRPKHVTGSHEIAMNSEGDVRFFTSFTRELYYPYNFVIKCGLGDRSGRIWTLSRTGRVPAMGDGEPPWPPLVGFETKISPELKESWPNVFNGNRTMVCVTVVTDCVNESVLEILNGLLVSNIDSTEGTVTAIGHPFVLF